MSDKVIEIPIIKLSPGPRVRSEVFDLDHVARLRLAIDDLPPITVRAVGDRFAIVDGEHRASAHRFEKRPTIRAEVIEADEAEALALAVEMNRPHGLPMTLAERKSAARRLVALTDWADQVIADRCGIHRSTVAEVRPVQPVGNQQVGRRTGSDGKARPATKVEQEAQRERIAAELAANPDASLGQIAEATGASKMTVAAVKAKTSTGAPVVPPATSSAPEGPNPSTAAGAPVEPSRPLAAVPPVVDPAPTAGEVDPVWHPSPGDWSKEEAFTVSNAARDFARVMDRRIPADRETPADLAAGCPAGMRDGAIAAAANAAAWWADLASALANPTPMEAVR